MGGRVEVDREGMFCLYLLTPKKAFFRLEWLILEVPIHLHSFLKEKSLEQARETSDSHVQTKI